MEIEFPQQIFGNSSGIKLHENPSIGSQIVPCGQTDRWKDAQTDMTKEISLYAFLRGLKEYAVLFKSIIRFAHNEISRKVQEFIHVAEGIDKRMLNRRTHLWRIDNARLPSIVPAGLNQKRNVGYL
jgi:hypothetical protein